MNATKAKSYVYPDEDAKILACASVPLLRRLFYGILAREGFRVSELLSLKWENIDLEHGSVRLDQNKTDQPRVWALGPDVVEALRRWKKNFSGSEAADQARAHDEDGQDPRRVPRSVRPSAGSEESGRDASGALPGRGRSAPAHDLRATFMTVSLAAGKTETWITDRTGHNSSQMIYRYKRAARFHAELKLGTLAPLQEAIPDLARVTS